MKTKKSFPVRFILKSACVFSVTTSFIILCIIAWHHHVQYDHYYDAQERYVVGFMSENLHTREEALARYEELKRTPVKHKKLQNVMTDAQAQDVKLIFNH